MELRPAKISRSAIVNVHTNYGKDMAKQYRFIRLLASQYKHPIILNYKAQLFEVRTCMNMTDHAFRKMIASCKASGLVKMEGDHLRLHSNNADRKYFKLSKKNDYHSTTDPEKFANLVLLHTYQSRQRATLRKKENQTHLGLQNSGSTYSSSVTNNSMPNHAITASCRGIANFFQFKSTSSAHKLLDKLQQQGLITLTQRSEQISCSQFKADLSQGKKNIRYENHSKVWFRILASDLTLNYNFKKRTPTKFDLLPPVTQDMYLAMGYSVDQINSLLK